MLEILRGDFALHCCGGPTWVAPFRRLLCRSSKNWARDPVHVRTCGRWSGARAPAEETRARMRCGRGAVPRRLRILRAGARIWSRQSVYRGRSRAVPGILRRKPGRFSGESGGAARGTGAARRSTRRVRFLGRGCGSQICSRRAGVLRPGIRRRKPPRNPLGCADSETGPGFPCGNRDPGAGLAGRRRARAGSRGGTQISPRKSGARGRESGASGARARGDAESGPRNAPGGRPGGRPGGSGGPKMRHFGAPGGARGRPGAWGGRFALHNVATSRSKMGPDYTSIRKGPRGVPPRVSKLPPGQCPQTPAGRDFRAKSPNSVRDRIPGFVRDGQIPQSGTEIPDFPHFGPADPFWRNGPEMAKCHFRA